MLRQRYRQVNECRMQVSYHIRNVPALSTIEMTLDLFMQQDANDERFSVESPVSKDDWEPGKGCDEVSGMGARGKGQGPFPRSAV